MFETFIYRNHLGEELKFGEGGLYVNTNDLHSFSWDVTSKNDRIYSFNRKMVEKKIPIIIFCETASEGIAMRNRLYEICEKDVMAKEYGRIIIGKYYLRCYVKASEKVEYLSSQKYMKATLTIITDLPYWTKETLYRFGYGSNSGGDNEGLYLDGKYDYPFDFTYSLLDTAIRNTGIIATNFKIVIYGACTSPTLVIGNKEYTVHANIEESEKLTIDSASKKIYLTKADGTTENCFNLREKNTEFYIFDKIASGTNIVRLENCYKADVTVYDERSEPKWT